MSRLLRDPHAPCGGAHPPASAPLSRRAWFWAASAGFAWLLGTAGRARTAYAGISQTRTLPYPPPHVFPTAVRYLRVDRGYRIVETDRDAGYILFEFDLARDRVGSGSLELYPVEDANGREASRVKITTGAGPVHLPYTLLDGLSAKMRAERGQPPPPKSGPNPPSRGEVDPPEGSGPKGGGPDAGSSSKE